MKTARPTTDAVLRERLRKADGERRELGERVRALEAVSLDQIEREERILSGRFNERLAAWLVVSGLILLAVAG